MNYEVNLKPRLKEELTRSVLKKIESFRNHYMFYNYLLNWTSSELVSNEELAKTLDCIDFEIQKRIEVENIGYFKMRDRLILDYSLAKNDVFEKLKSIVNDLECRLFQMKLLSERVIELRSSLSSANERLAKFLEHLESHSEESIEQQRQKILRIEREISSILSLSFEQIQIGRIERESEIQKEFAKIEKEFTDMKIIIGKPYYSKSRLFVFVLCMSVLLIFSFYYMGKRIERNKEEDRVKLSIYKKEISESTLYKTAVLLTDKERFEEMDDYKKAFIFSDEMVSNNEDFMKKMAKALLGACSFSLNTKTGYVTNKAEIGQVMKLEELVGQDIEIQTYGKVGSKPFEFGTCFSRNKKRIDDNSFNVKTICEGIGDVGFRLKVFVGTKLFQFEIGTPNTGTTASLNRDIKKSIYCRR